MITATTNWKISDSASQLSCIHEDDRNIAIWRRSIGHLSNEVDRLVRRRADLRISGDLELIIDKLERNTKTADCNLFVGDVRQLLEEFTNITGNTSFKVFLGTVNTNMCRRFHYDMNHLRMLCTYMGPGTLWLEEENLDRNALEALEGNEKIVLESARIRQVGEGHVAVLKGALYSAKGTKPVVHRSPTIEEAGQERLLLRIDTNRM